MNEIKVDVYFIKQFMTMYDTIYASIMYLYSCEKAHCYGVTYWLAKSLRRIKYGILRF